MVGNGEEPIQENKILSLADVAQWIEHQPTNQKDVGSIPSQVIPLGCSPGAQ